MRTSWMDVYRIASRCVQCATFCPHGFTVGTAQQSAQDKAGTLVAAAIPPASQPAPKCLCSGGFALAQVIIRTPQIPTIYPTTTLNPQQSTLVR